jgi:hypothetical protein
MTTFHRHYRSIIATIAALIVGVIVGSALAPLGAVAQPQNSLQTRVAHLEAVVAEVLLALEALGQRVEVLETGDGGGGGECLPDGAACETADGLPGVYLGCDCIPFDPAP